MALAVGVPDEPPRTAEDVEELRRAVAADEGVTEVHKSTIEVHSFVADKASSDSVGYTRSEIEGQLPYRR